ncbi:MAG: hypothetical protein ABMA64_25865 [Myxococcota bacterium]
MWGWAISAFAGPAPEAVHELGGRYPAAELVVSCSPLAAVTGIARSVPLPPALTASPIPRLLSELSTDGAAAAAGIDDAQGFTLVVHPDSGLKELRLPFSGSVEQAGALVARIDPGAAPAASGEAAEPREASWTLTVKGAPHRALLHGGWLSVSSGETSAASASPDPRPALDGIPDVAGCAVRLRDKKGADKLEAMHAFLPLAGGAPAIARFTLPEALPPALRRTDADIPVGRVLQPPSMVMTVSAPLDELLLGALTGDSEAVPAREALQGLMEEVRIPDGGSIAFLGNPRKGGQWVGMVRLVGVDRKLKVGGLVKTLARNGKASGVVRTGSRSLVVYGDKSVVYAQFADDGRVAVGSNPLVVVAALSEAGEPWLDAAGLAAARTSPLLLRTVDPAGSLGLTVGVRPWDERVIELFVDAKLSDTDRAALQQNLGPMIGMMIPILMMQGKEQPAGLPFKLPGL